MAPKCTYSACSCFRCIFLSFFSFFFCRFRRALRFRFEIVDSSWELLVSEIPSWGKQFTPNSFNVVIKVEVQETKSYAYDTEERLVV